MRGSCCADRWIPDVAPLKMTSQFTTTNAAATVCTNMAPVAHGQRTVSARSAHGQHTVRVDVASYNAKLPAKVF